MRIPILLLLLSSCTSSLSVSSARPGDVLLAPVPVKSSPKAHELHTEGYSLEWGDRKIRAYLAPTKLQGQDPDTQRMYGFGPVIEVRTTKSLRLLDLSERFPSHCLEAMFHDQWNKRIWVLTQACIEGPSDAYTLWITEDGGEHWFQGADLVRPAPRFPPSDLFTLFVDGKGKGEAWFKLDASHATLGAAEGADLSHGQELIYKSFTMDGGRSWTVNREPLFSNGMLGVERK